MFQNLTIKVRLIFVIGFLAVELIVGFAVGMLNIESGNDKLEYMFNNQLMGLTQLSEVERQILQNQLVMVRASTPGADSSAFLAQVDQSVASSEQAWAAFMSTALKPEARQIAQRFDVAHANYLDRA